MPSRRLVTVTNTGNSVIANVLTAVIFPLTFHWWSRLAEFTADLGGLLACQNVNHTTGAWRRSKWRLAATSAS